MQSTNLNVAPIFEDFDEGKNYHRVLFNAGKSVQARELTQAQSILQSQIERLGKHLFTEGSMVVPGGIQAIESQDYAKLTLDSNSLFVYFSSESDLYVKSNTTGLIAKVAKSFDAEGVNPVSIFFDVLTPGTAQEKKLLVNDNITFFVYNTNNTIRNIATASISEIGKGSWVKVQAGIYFVRGMFVKTFDQDYVVSKYTTDKTVKIGFHVNEQIVTSADDITLFSNANGFPNQNSSGASRLKITLTLTNLGVTAVDKDFIEIARFDGGTLSSKIDYTNYSIVEKAIAQRSFETNGDYVVNDFKMDIKQHLKAGSNSGVYTLANGGDESKLISAMKPGIAYVKGYRVENIGIQNAVFDKARDTQFLNNASYTADYGQYFLVNNMKSLPDMDIKKKLLLLASDSSIIGNALVRAIRKDGSNYRVYIFDMNLIFPKVVSNIASIKYTDSSSLFTATLTSSVLYDSNKSTLLFPLPISAVKTLSQYGSDTSYTVLRSFTLTTNSLGKTSVTAGGSEFFGAVDAITYFVALTGSASVGTQFNPTACLSLGGTIGGTVLNIDLGLSQANATIKVVAPIVKSQTTQKAKTLITITNEEIAFPLTNRQKFSKSDIYKIISVKDKTTQEDLTARFTFESGQKDSWYECGRLIVSNSEFITRTVQVTYSYFSHSSGDYFTVDSYSGIKREDIPYFAGNNLSDYIDFRPLKDVNDVFTSVTYAGEMIKPGDTIRADITFYLPRIDIICTNALGIFSSVRGVSSLNPVAPATPFESLKLYEMLIPAYTMKISDISVKSIDNKRYTMRDIGRLENRISNIEYYATLSSLESATNKSEVLDPVTGNNRFKNGFAVDGFKDFRLADNTHPEFAASMDIAMGRLNPSYVENAIQFLPSQMNKVVKPSSVFMKQYTETPAITQPYATSTYNVNPYAVFTWIGKVTLAPDRDYWRDVKYIQPIVINNTINLRGNAVEGLIWSAWAQTSYDMLGGHRDWSSSQKVSYQTQNTFEESNFSTATENTISTSLITYMRSIPITFTCTGFRPFTRIYPFFDSLDITNDCTPTGGVSGQAIITDANGQATGIFVVPNRVDKHFTTGESVFKFSDSLEDKPELVTSSGSTTFLSGGLLDMRQVTTVNTKVLTFTNTSTGGVRYIDPIAQTFIVPNSGGCFSTKVDIFFSTKARNVPVTLQIRTANSGIPTSEIVSSVTLNPNQVNTSTDGTAITSFVFSDPIFLKEGIEYAIVLVADTIEYNVYVAQQGQNVIGMNMALSKQAYMGVFLTSSNGSTWNALQNTDMKFTLHRAIFDTAESSIVFDNIDTIALPLTFNAITTLSGSNVLTALLKSHGLLVGDTVVVSGSTIGNGVLSSDINGSKTVTATTVDTFSYLSTTLASATGTIGGLSIKAKVNYPFNTFLNNLDMFITDGGKILWEYQYTGQSNRIKSGWFPMDTEIGVNTRSEGIIRGAGDFQIRATINTTKDNLSPMIGYDGFNNILISPRVDKTSKIFTYVSSDIKFNKPNTHARFIVGAKLPGIAGMKLYIKEIDTADQDIPSTQWVEMIPNNPIANSESFVEYEYVLDGVFIGYKVKVELTGSNENIPSLSDIRTIAYA